MRVLSRWVLVVGMVGGFFVCLVRSVMSFFRMAAGAFGDGAGLTADQKCLEARLDDCKQWKTGRRCSARRWSWRIYLHL